MTQRAIEEFATIKEAYDAAHRIVADLADADHAHSDTLEDDTDADVYGVSFEGSNYYLKLAIDEAAEQVKIYSLHPPDRPLRTRRGVLT